MLENQNDLSSIKLIDFGLSVKYDDSSFLNVLNDRWGTLIFMAPEIIENKDYNKSVDLWSIGILTYMLISGGVHPFYKKGMDTKTYTELLKSCPKLTFDDSKFSKLAIDLISKMLNSQTIDRYNTDQALKHPWITRWNESVIPITYNDLLKNFEIEDKMRQAVMAMFFCSVVKAQDDPDAIKPQPKYRALMDKVTIVIDKWQNQLKKTDFVNDEDFIEYQASPSKFETASDFSQAFNDYDSNANSQKQSRESSSPRALSPNKSIGGDSTPTSDRSYNIINPIRIECDKSSNQETQNGKYVHQETKGSDKTADTEVKNTQRIQSKSLISKPKIDSTKKIITRNRRNKLKSPHKPNRAKVNIPKQKSITVRNEIQGVNNFSVIDETTINEKLIERGQISSMNNSYMTATKDKKKYEDLSEGSERHEMTGKKLFSNKHLSNAIIANDYNEVKNGRMVRSKNNNGKKSSLSQKQTQHWQINFDFKKSKRNKKLIKNDFEKQLSQIPSIIISMLKNNDSFSKNMDFKKPNTYKKQAFEQYNNNAQVIKSNYDERRKDRR